MRLWHLLHNRLPSLFLRDRRDARGTGLVDDAIRDVLYALRTFRRTPLVALTIVSTVGLGLGLVAVAFSVAERGVVPHRSRAERAPDLHAGAAANLGGRGRPRLHARAVRSPVFGDTDVFSAAYAEVAEVDIRFDGRKGFQATLTTGNFFQVVGVGTAIGRGVLAG